MRECVTIEEVNSGGQATPGIGASLTRELLETWCDTQLQWVTYETKITPPLWDQVVRHIRGYLVTLWAMGVLRGKTTKESFVVTCEHTTMTHADTHEGHLSFLVSVAPVNPSEFLHYRIRIRLKSHQPSTRHGVTSLLA